MKRFFLIILVLSLLVLPAAAEVQQLITNSTGHVYGAWISPEGTLHGWYMNEDAAEMQHVTWNEGVADAVAYDDPFSDVLVTGFIPDTDHPAALYGGFYTNPLQVVPGLPGAPTEEWNTIDLVAELDVDYENNEQFNIVHAEFTGEYLALICDWRPLDASTSQFPHTLLMIDEDGWIEQYEFDYYEYGLPTVICEYGENFLLGCTDELNSEVRFYEMDEYGDILGLVHTVSDMNAWQFCGAEWSEEENALYCVICDTLYRCDMATGETAPLHTFPESLYFPYNPTYILPHPDGSVVIDNLFALYLVTE